MIGEAAKFGVTKAYQALDHFAVGKTRMIGSPSLKLQEAKLA
jgi:hypothetical protein